MVPDCYGAESQDENEWVWPVLHKNRWSQQQPPHVGLALRLKHAAKQASEASSHASMTTYPPSISSNRVFLSSFAPQSSPKNCPTTMLKMTGAKRLIQKPCLLRPIDTSYRGSHRVHLGKSVGFSASQASPFLLQHRLHGRPNPSLLQLFWHAPASNPHRSRRSRWISVSSGSPEQPRVAKKREVMTIILRVVSMANGLS